MDDSKSATNLTFSTSMRGFSHFIKLNDYQSLINNILCNVIQLGREGSLTLLDAHITSIRKEKKNYKYIQRQCLLKSST